MKKSEQNTLEIATDQRVTSFAGAIPSSRWITGSGRYVSKRPIPPHCEEMTIGDAKKIGGKTEKAVKRMLKVYPKCRKCIVVTDWRAVGRLIKSMNEEEAQKE